MGGINISHEVKPLHKRIVDKWGSKGFKIPIERLANDLRSQYTDEEIRDLEVDFIGYSIRGYYPDTIIPAEFLDKVGAIVALLNNPYEYTADLFGFVNVVAVCNDIPQTREDIQIMPPQYITRTLTAVNEILPADYDMDSVYLHNNIQNFIFSCYSDYDFYILDGRLGTYNYDFLSKLNLPYKITKSLIELRPMLETIKESIKKSKWEIRKILKGEVSTDNSIYNMVADVLQQDFSELLKDNLKKFIMACVYDLHYATLLEEREDV